MTYLSRVIKSSRVIDETVNSKLDIEKNNKRDISENIIEDAKKKYDCLIKAAENEANNIISNANVKVDKILESTYEKAEALLENARNTGFNEGYEVGYNEGKLISDNLIKESNEIKENYLKEREFTLNNIEKDVIDLVISSTEKILNYKINNDSEMIISIIKNGLNKLNNSSNIIVRICKEDYDIVELSKDKILSDVSLIEDINFKVDNTLKKGDCIIETANGIVDTSIQSQVKELKKILYDLLTSE